MRHWKGKHKVLDSKILGKRLSELVCTENVSDFFGFQNDLKFLPKQFRLEKKNIKTL